MIISIDGPAGCGKSTVAGTLAHKLGFVHFNSGKLYRAITAHLIYNDFDLTNISTTTINFPVQLEAKFKNGVQHVFVNGKDYTQHLYENIISVNAPLVSKNPYFRSVIDVCQRDFAKQYNLVVDGRDIGSFVFPNADIKFYLDCAIEERARRRFKELGGTVNMQQLIKEIEERDHIDKTKKVAPLVVPKGAHVVDSTNLTINEVVEELYKIVQKTKRI